MVHQEIKPSDPNINLKEAKHAGNKIQNTLQKMFHVDPAEKVKHKNGSKAHSITSNESEAENRSSAASSVKSSDRQSSRANNSTTNQQQNVCKQNVRFRKNADGSHVHCLQHFKKTHRLPNFLRELGIIHHVPVEQQQQVINNNNNNNNNSDDGVKLPSKNSYSETSLLEKYGKPQEIIGKGAFGVVRVAHKTVPRIPGEKLFAVKEFKRKHNEPQKKYIKRLTSEFCISSSLHHINVIDTLDLLQDTQGNYCEVMEYCPGGDLYSLIISNGPLEQEEADCFFSQLINGVKYLHDNGVAHRDLKPENLLLTSNGCLKITDFGNSECFRVAWENHAHLSRGVCGSGPYIAPEEFSKNWFDPRLVDVWACGIIYMTMIVGQYLWRVAKAEEDPYYNAYLEARKIGKTLNAFQKLSDNRRQTITKIIEPNPEERYTTEQIVQNPWFSSIYTCFKPAVPIGSNNTNSIKNTTNDDNIKNNGSSSDSDNDNHNANTNFIKNTTNDDNIKDNNSSSSSDNDNHNTTCGAKVATQDIFS